MVIWRCNYRDEVKSVVGVAIFFYLLAAHSGLLVSFSSLFAINNRYLSVCVLKQNFIFIFKQVLHRTHLSNTVSIRRFGVLSHPRIDRPVSLPALLTFFYVLFYSVCYQTNHGRGADCACSSELNLITLSHRQAAVLSLSQMKYDFFGTEELSSCQLSRSNACGIAAKLQFYVGIDVVRILRTYRYSLLFPSSFGFPSFWCRNSGPLLYLSALIAL